MLEIRTITKKLTETESFDAEVNQAIADGWRLRKRNVIIPQTQPAEGAKEVMLYAELERGRVYKPASEYDTGRTVLK